MKNFFGITIAVLDDGGILACLAMTVLAPNAVYHHCYRMFVALRQFECFVSHSPITCLSVITSVTLSVGARSPCTH